MTYKKLAFAVVGGLMLFPHLLMSKDLADKVEMPVEKNQIVRIDPALLEQEPEFELQDSSEIKIISEFGAKMREVRIYKSLDGKFDVGVSRIDKAALRFQDWPRDEFVYLVKGQVEIIDQNRNAQIFEPGDSIVIPKDFSGVWRQLSPVTMITIEYSTESP
jgi:uncharacterized cupin superfamily protein